ncbi:MAG TPA: hypothetical protein PK728_00900 [Bacillota bacterium]|nr:hypothetical protein [Bacillota bacterium]
MGFGEWLQNTDQGIFLFVISFANAVFFPVGPEVFFIPILIVNPSKFFPYSSCCVIGAVLGLMVTYYLSHLCGQTMIKKYVPSKKIESGARLFSMYGPWALVVASMFPVFPFRILVIISGFLRQRPLLVFSLLTVGKTLRFFSYGFLVAKLGESVLKYLKY